MTFKPASGKINRVSANNLVADAHAAPTQNAVLVIADEERVVILEKWSGQFELVAGFTYAKVIGVLLK